MKTLIVFEKHDQKRTLKYFTIPGEIVAVTVNPYTGTKFYYPSGLTYQDLPGIWPMQQKFNMAEGGKWCFRFFNVDRKDNSMKEFDKNFYFDPEKANEFLNQFNLIIIATDTDHSGELGARKFMQHGGMSAKEPHIVRLWQNRGLDEKSFKLCLEEMKHWGDSFFTKIYERGMVKRHFEYNFNLMSHIVFSDLLKSVGVQGEQLWISKYQLLLLHLLHARTKEGLGFPPIFRLIHDLQSYKGTGKFTNDYSLSEGVGSPASRSYLVEGLKEVGLIHETGFTDTGYRFLDRLHKKTFDPDLPFRLSQWADEGWDEAKPKVDRYLKTLFGKQLRYQSQFFK